MKPLLYLMTLAGVLAAGLGIAGTVMGTGLYAWLLTLAGLFLALGGFTTIMTSGAHETLHNRERISSADRLLAEQLELARLHSKGAFVDPHVAEAVAVTEQKLQPRPKPRQEDGKPRRRRRALSSEGPRV